jgi:hypothetical protein
MRESISSRNRLNFGIQSLPGSGNMSVKIERSGTGFFRQNQPFRPALV